MPKKIQIKKIEIYHADIEFKEKFSHALKSRKSSENIILKVFSENNVGYGECLPREYVTGENPLMVIQTLKNKIIPHFKEIKFTSKTQALNKLWEFRQTIKKKELSAFAAFETALIHLLAKEFDLTIQDLFKFFKIKPDTQKTVNYSAAISDKPLPLMLLKSAVIKKMGFKQVKVKVSHESLSKLKYLKKILKTQDIRIDANCSLTLKEISENLEMLKKLNITTIEQPFKINCETTKTLQKIAKNNNLNLIADEDLCNLSDLKKLKGKYNTLNIRISKVGGLLSSIYMYKFAKENNYQVILGCLVGETILSRLNLILAQNFETNANEGNYDRFLLNLPIIENPNFEDNGNFTQKPLKLNYKTKINQNLKDQTIQKITIE